jgi:transglutaminase-like putative cysteine protease
MPFDKPLVVCGAPEDFLRCTDVVDFDEATVSQLALSIFGGHEIEVLWRTFETVRDQYPHSRDVGAGEVACTASDVIRLGHGLCYAKSHLLAALLRHNGIPAGFCYQRLADKKGGFELHGLNAVLVNGGWVRIDARGNNEDVRVEFELAGDMLAYVPDETRGERDYNVVFPKPDAGVIRLLRDGASRKLSALTLPSDLSCPL